METWLIDEFLAVAKAEEVAVKMPVAVPSITAELRYRVITCQTEARRLLSSPTRFAPLGIPLLSATESQKYILYVSTLLGIEIPTPRGEPQTGGTSIRRSEPYASSPSSDSQGQERMSRTSKA